MSSNIKNQEKKRKVYSFEDILATKGYLVYTNVGTSMMPLLRQRKDLIEIRAKDPAIRCRKYDIVLYKQGVKYILHRILKVYPNYYVIAGDHCIRKEYGITDAHILGVVTRIVRDGKIITTEDFWYKLYVHLWCDFYYIRVVILYLKFLAHTIYRKKQKFFIKGERR